MEQDVSCSQPSAGVETEQVWMLFNSSVTLPPPSRFITRKPSVLCYGVTNNLLAINNYLIKISRKKWKMRKNILIAEHLHEMFRKH